MIRAPKLLIFGGAFVRYKKDSTHDPLIVDLEIVGGGEDFLRSPIFFGRCAPPAEDWPLAGDNVLSFGVTFDGLSNGDN